MVELAARQDAVSPGRRTPVGAIHVVDPPALNWLLITSRPRLKKGIVVRL